MSQMKKEVWKDAKGYEGSYQVSNWGRVKSLKCNKQRFLKTPPDSNGYYRCNLHKNGKQKMFTVHKLVAVSFLGHVPEGYKMVVDHIDNDRSNNLLENLQLITARQNSSKDRKGGSSKYVGVYWHKATSKWRAQIWIDCRLKNLGYFTNEIEAAEAYQSKLTEISK